MDIDGELVEDPFQMCDHLHLTLFERVQHRHQDATGMGSSIRRRAEADFASDDRGPQIAFGQVILGRHPAVIGPVIETIGIGPEDLLEATDAQVGRWLLHGRDDLRFQHGRLAGELKI